MIYQFSTQVDKKSRPKDFYITADNDTSFYRRCLEQYSLAKENINIIRKISDEEIDKRDSEPKVSSKEFLPSYINHNKDIDNLFSNKINGLNESEIKAKKDIGWKVFKFKTKKEINKYFNKYTSVKLYYIKNGKRKDKDYIVLCK